MIGTTIEQSKRLIEAGYLPETADMHWFLGVETPMLYATRCFYYSGQEFVVPAWSLGALWDLCEDYNLSFSTQEDRTDGIIETLVRKLVDKSPYDYDN